MLSLFIEAYLQEIGESEEGTSDREAHITSILLSLFGWELKEGNEVVCKECNRVVGLWNYQDKLNKSLCDVSGVIDSLIIVCETQ